MADVKLPELLAPAGSLRSLEAAVAAGADAVYFGAKSFNARAGADNFSDDEIVSAIKYLKTLGVKSNITMNTQLYEGELFDALRSAELVLNAGADAIITADLGLASLIKRYFPEAQLHASTQVCGENTENAKMLESFGFSRMVAAREIDLQSLRKLCEGSPIETEIFVHGALCVSHSGACLMSSVIGGRSGNRGECAQPCRLPYKCRGCEYPLSLKDLALASHIEDILPLGIASLKVEGRLKSPEYVYGVISVYRRLLDEGRNAAKEEMEYLASLFSRSGFTNGYFEEKISRSMLGVRTEENKSASRAAQVDVKYGKKLPVRMHARLFSGEPIKLSGTVMRGEEAFSAEVSGAVAEEARTSPVSADRVRENLLKLGTTVFEAKASDVTVDTGENVMIPMSAVNAVRRELCEKLTSLLDGKKEEKHPIYNKDKFPFLRSDRKSAYFVYASSVTQKALAYFDDIFVPMDEYVSTDISKQKNVGVAIQPVAFDKELAAVREKLKKCASLGCKKALITNLWQVDMAKSLGVELHGDMRLNVWNPYSASVYENLGFKSVIISPEVFSSKASRLGAGIARGVIAYGKIPVMTLEKCIIRDMNGISLPREKCTFCDGKKFSYLKDRTDTVFPIAREAGHRNVIFNSVPIYMLDKDSAGLFSHFVFTDEKPNEVDTVIECAKKKSAPRGKFKRI
ncbi:MAG: U32 family peptidase [Ruminococcaceae bacterium]|nr:U32 family peptidase [Oscillospiraceae bacterium]